MLTLKEFLKNIIIIILLLILVDVCYSKFIKNDQPVKIFGKSFLIVTTGSMEPTIKSGELIIISENDNYEINDIVTYIDNDNFLITHRIISINEENGVITKGDGNNIEDDEIEISRIKGKVIYHSKILGFFVIYLLKPLIIAYIFAFVIINLINILDKKRSLKNEKNSSFNN